MLSGHRCLKANRHDGLKATKLSYGFREVFENYFKICPFHNKRSTKESYKVNVIRRIVQKVKVSVISKQTKQEYSYVFMKDFSFHSH